MIQTLKGAVWSASLLLKSKVKNRSTDLWGLSSKGKGKLKVNPPSTRYSVLESVGAGSVRPLNKVPKIIYAIY